MSGKEISLGDLRRAERYIGDNDTLYECHVKVIKYDLKVKEKYKYIIENPLPRKYKKIGILPCYTDSSSLSVETIFGCSGVGKIKFKKDKKCEADD